ncbi:MAG: hypothetical protein COA38_07465 [Fluviicola sp.]|nr:MAG: hypothetical protein COA38_07465 [Fluviicola sp.]
MKIVVGIITIVILIGCSSSDEKKNPDSFYDIKGLNADIKTALDFDLLEIKKRTDSVYQTDEDYYIDLIKEMSGGSDKNCFDRAGIPLDMINAKGEHLNRVQSKDSLARLMMLSYAENINMSDCSAQTNDSICIYKSDWKNIMEDFDPREAQMGYSFLLQDFGELYLNNYLSDDEFQYMILYLHYLAVLAATDLTPDY